MSGVYIKGMEMPTGCGVTVTIYADGRVVEFLGYGKKRDLGTAVPVQPHGRLIDADKMEESIKMQSSYIKLIGGDIAKIAETLEKGALQEIANAPTVLEAEEGKNA